MDLSKYTPKQIQVPYLGALFDLVSKGLAIIGAFNFIALTRNWFYDENDTVLRDVFGTYALFMFAVLVVGFIGLVFIHVFLVPSLNSHTQKQAVIEGRSPTYEKLCEMDERMKRLEEKL